MKKTKHENIKKVNTIKASKEAEQLAVPVQAKLWGGFDKGDIHTSIDGGSTTAMSLINPTGTNESITTKGGPPGSLSVLKHRPTGVVIKPTLRPESQVKYAPSISSLIAAGEPPQVYKNRAHS